MYAKANQIFQQPLEMNISTTIVGSSFDPDMFGPPFWFVLHNAAVSYYDNPNQTAKIMMKSFIKSLPIVIPCIKCKEHAYVYLKEQNIDAAVLNRSNLFKFFTTFHNYVNSKGGRPSMSLENAKELYGFYNSNIGSSMKITYS